MNREQIVKRSGIIFTSLTLVCIAFTAFLIFESGIIKGLSAEIDTITERDRFNQQKREVAEGQFYDRNGAAVTEKAEKGKAGKVLHPEYSYIIGYNSDMYTLSGLRRAYKDYLYMPGRDQEGAAVHLTTDNELMSYAQELLTEKSSILVMDASGAILAMVSRDIGPYDANQIDTRWEEYNERDEFLLDRNLISATPGSTFKIITASCAIDAGLEEYEWNDEGDYLGIHNAGNKAYGPLTMDQAFAKSVNTYFASLGVKAGEEALRDTCESFCLGQPMTTDFGTIDSHINFKEGADADVAQVAFGAGDTRITPVHLGMIASAVCQNGGNMKRPYLVETISDDGKTKYSHETDTIGTVLSPKTADKVKMLMKSAAIDYGLTDKSCRTTVYAKTGTAQLTNDRKGDNKIWLVAATNQYTIVISRDETMDSSHSLIKPVKKLITYMEGR